MILVIDGKTYYLNGEKVMEHLASFYVEKNKELQVIDTGDGRKLDFTKKSVIRTAMKAAMVPFAVPVIGLLFRLRGLEPPKHAKHEDMIDWMVLRMIQFAGIAEQDLVLNATTESMEDTTSNVRRISTISTYGSDLLNRRRFLPEPERQVEAIGPEREEQV